VTKVPYTIEQTFDVDMAPQPVAIARVSQHGTLYRGYSRIRGARVRRERAAALARDIAPDQAKKSPIAIDVDPAGNILVFLRDRRARSRSAGAAREHGVREG
jgi:hypothetical protein